MGQSLGRSTEARPPRMGARRIYAELRDQILGGVYATGSQLPSSRGLAAELGVSRTTVTVAYEQLAAEGFVTLQQGARPRVAPMAQGPSPRRVARTAQEPAHLSAYGERLRAAAPWPDYLPNQPPIDFRYGDLAPSDFPDLIWRRAMTAAMARKPPRLAYEDPRGALRLRQALQGYLWRARTLSCDIGQIVIVNGSQQGLDLCARLLLDPGDRFVIENPCYRMARQIFASSGGVAVPVAVDRDGIETARLAGIRARLAYVTPSHQFPLGGVLPIARRHQLLAWARSTGAYVIEDDYDSEYRYDINPVPPLHGLEESGRVIYLGTVSKTLSPLLRLGYLVVPPEMQEVFATAKQLLDRHSPVAEQEALAELLETGAYESHVRRVRRLNGERRAVLLAALRRAFGDRIAVEGADAGLHVVVWFNALPCAAEPRLIAAARRAGVGLHSLAPLYAPGAEGAPAGRIGLVMGYSALSPRQIEKGVQLLRAAVEQLDG